MAAKKQVVKQKAKKKKWCSIYAPATFGNQLIGESYIESAEQLKGRYISANLATITNDMKKQNITVKLRINKIVEGKAQTEIIGMQLVQGFVKRLVRRGRTKIDDSFIVKSKDGQVVRIKPLILTNTNCVSSTATQIRVEARKLLTERVSRTGFINTVQDTLNFKVQKDIKDALNRIHPIRSVDIRSFSRETVRGNVPEAELELLPEEEVKAIDKQAQNEPTDDDALDEEDDDKEEEESDEQVEETADEPEEEKKE